MNTEPDISAINRALVYPLSTTERELREACGALANAEALALHLEDQGISKRPSRGYVAHVPERVALKGCQKAVKEAEQRRDASLAALTKAKESSTTWLTCAAHFRPGTVESFAPGDAVPAYRLAVSGWSLYERVRDLIQQGYLVENVNFPAEVDPPRFRVVRPFPLGRGVRNEGELLDASEIPSHRVQNLTDRGLIEDLSSPGPGAA